MKTPALLGPDGKTALRDYAGYHGGAGGFGGQLRARIHRVKAQMLRYCLIFPW